MHDFPASAGHPDFTEAANGGALAELVLLRCGEMEETQLHSAGAIGDAANQAAAFAEYYITQLNGSLYQGFTKGLCGANRCEASAILVTQRQMK